MPRAGLTTAGVVSAGARLADDAGFHNLAMGPLAKRLSVRTPSLYKHVGGLADLRHRIAVQAMTELGDRVRDAMRGRAGADALAAVAGVFRSYVTAHPGRYAATIGAEVTGPDDPLLKANTRVLDSIAAVLRGYDVDEDKLTHVIWTLRCMLHGFAALQASGGFQWTDDPGDSFDWMIRFIDCGLRPAAGEWNGSG